MSEFVSTRPRVQATLEYFGLVEDPAKARSGPRPIDWFAVLAPLVCALPIVVIHGLLAGVLMLAALSPITINELREARGGVRLNEAHPYLDALFGAPLSVLAVAVIAPSASLPWYLGAIVVGVLLSEFMARRRVVARRMERRRLWRRVQRGI
ncbi:MAG: hypothetical protein Q7T99_02885 [Pseudomonas sp.]|nr:hypothetical protein [Pseudomonas sp.]